MSSFPSEDRTDLQPFLRTGPETTLHARIQDRPDADTSRPICADPLFPAPAVDRKVLSRLDVWDRFTALAVRIDPPVTADENGALHAALSRCLEKIEEEFGAIWFKWDASLYGCAVPGINAATAEPLARRIGQGLSENRVETISTGISEFPLLNFQRVATLQNACKALDHAAFFGPGSIVTFDAVSLNVSGDHLYQTGHIDAAIDEYKAALHLDAGNVNVHNSLGVCLAQKNDRAGAFAAFEEAHRLDPSEAMAVYNTGVLHLLDETPEQALACFQKAYAVDSQTVDIVFQIGKIFTEQKNYEEAERYLQSALALQEDCAPAYTLLGRCLAATGRNRDAIAAFKRAVKLNPNDAAALSELGTLYAARGENPDICITFCRQSVALSPENSLFRVRLGRLYHKYNQLDQALVEYETAATLGRNTSRQIAQIQEQLDALQGGRQYCA